MADHRAARSGLERTHETREALRIPPRRPVPEEDERRLEPGEPARGLSVAGGVRGEEARRLVKPRSPGQGMAAEEHVAEDEGAVALAPQGDVARGVSGRVEDDKARDSVALAQPPSHAMRRPREGALGEPVEQVVGLARRELTILERVGIPLARPERHAEVLADRAAGPLVIGVCVGYYVGGERSASEPAKDAPAGVAGGGIDEHILDEVGVDRVRREAAEPEDPCRELLHPGHGTPVA